MTESYGTRGVDRADVDDLRLEPSVAWAPTPWLFVSVVAPLAYRRVARTDLTLEEHVAPADPELRARITLLGLGPRVPRDLLGLSLAIDIPLMISPTAGQGDQVSMEAMIGSGSADPAAGLWYTHHERDVDVLAMLGWRFPTEGFGRMRMGPSFDSSLAVQWRPLRELGLRLGADSRLEVPGVMDGAQMVNTGGFSARVLADVVLVPSPSFSITVGARVPVIQALHGAHDLGPTLLASVLGEL